MVKHMLSFARQNHFLVFGGGFVFVSFLFLILAMSGLFLPVLILPLITLFSASSIFTLFSFWKSIPKKEKLGLFLIVLVTIGAAYFSRMEPTVFTGRDQGSISIAAIELAKNHRLTFTLPLATDFFTIYGKGAALNFPGFFYTDGGSLITQFPLGYTAFLASFFQTFGLVGLTIGNGVILLASFLTLYRLLQKLAPKVFGPGMILFASSLIPLFLFHLTLTENFALFLFLFLTLQLTEFFQEKSAASYFGVLLPALFFPFVRIEGFAFLCITILMLASMKESRQFIQKRFLERCILPFSFFMLVFMASFFVNDPFYRTIGKAFIKSFSSTSSSEAATSLFALPVVLSLYGLLPILIAGLIGSFILLQSKKWLLLIPVFLAFPTFIYFFSPSITPDHPWMLRRFLFSIWPSLLLTFLFTLETLLEKKYIRKSVTFILPLLLTLGQVPAFFSFSSPKNDVSLLSQVASFSSHFSSTDRILIDREVTGDGFTMVSGPAASLFGIDAAYFFNPLDMKNLPVHDGVTTYLLVPEKKISFYEENMRDFLLTPKQGMNFTYNMRETLPVAIPSFPQLTERSVTSILLEVTPKH